MPIRNCCEASAIGPPVARLWFWRWRRTLRMTGGCTRCAVRFQDLLRRVGFCQLSASSMPSLPEHDPLFRSDLAEAEAMILFPKQRP
jgi:hypothetical protein